MKNIYKPDLEYKINNNGIEIIGCKKSVQALTIPTKIEGMPVTCIGNHAFGHTEVREQKETVIPNSVTHIGIGAFTDVYGLLSVTIPESVECISYCAFDACCDLEKITILNPDCEIDNSSNTISNYFDKNSEQGRFNGTIYGYKNSTAQKYAEKHKCKFVAIDKNANKFVRISAMNSIVVGRIYNDDSCAELIELFTDSKNKFSINFLKNSDIAYSFLPECTEVLDILKKGIIGVTMKTIAEELIEKGYIEKTWNEIFGEQTQNN